MLKINDNVKFHYLKQFKDELKAGQVLTDYTDQSESYSGKIVDVRNIIDQPVSQDTIRRANIKGRRSEMLYTVELVDGDVKAFYDGRMVGTQVLPAAKRGIWKTIASAFAVRKPQAVS
jgi:cytidylate kinase